MKIARWTLLLLMGTPLMGCPIRTEHKVETTHKIEAHIVIDVRKVQQEAEQIESEVRGQTDVPKAEPDPGSQSGARLVESEPVERLATPRRSFWSIFDLSTPAYADEPGEAEAIARRKARAAEIRSALDKGCFGENNRGYLDLRSCSELEQASEKSRLQVLMDDENRDRRIVYTAVGRREGLEDEQIDAIGSIFAGEIRKLLAPGNAFQVPETEAHYASFLDSDLGKKLGKPKPGEWVRVP